MNRLLLLFLAALPYCLSAQVINRGGENFLAFTMHFPEDSTSLTGVDWGREHLEATFTLQGKTPLTYRVRPLNDTLMELWQLRGNNWQLQEHINYFGWALHRRDGNTIISELKITDFDHDGDEDLQCWVTTNVNGNEWTVLFLNDQKQQKLVRLVNTTAPRGDGIWDAPTYDPETGLIHTELFSGAHGVQNAATYRLNGTTAEPLAMEEEDMGNPDYILYTTYKGENGKWIIEQQEAEGEANGWVNLEQQGYVMFDFEPVFDKNGELDFANQDIYTDFSPKGITPATYRLKVIDNNTIALLQQAGGNWIQFDTISCNTENWDIMEGRPMVSSFKVIDFDYDGGLMLM